MRVDHRLVQSAYVHSPGWYEALDRRWHAAQEAARRDDCGRCGGASAGFQHFAYPSECRPRA